MDLRFGHVLQIGADQQWRFSLMHTNTCKTTTKHECKSFLQIFVVAFFCYEAPEFMRIKKKWQSVAKKWSHAEYLANKYIACHAQGLSGRGSHRYLHNP